MINQDQLKALHSRLSKIQEYLKIDEKRMKLKEEELRTQDPDFWNDPKKAEAQMKAIRGLKFWVESFDGLDAGYNDLEVLYEFAKEGEAEESEVDEQTQMVAQVD